MSPAQRQPRRRSLSPKSGGEGVPRVVPEEPKDPEALPCEVRFCRKHHAMRAGAVEDMVRRYPNPDVTNTVALPHDDGVAFGGPPDPCPVGPGQGRVDMPLSDGHVPEGRRDLDIDSETLAPDQSGTMRALADTHYVRKPDISQSPSGRTGGQWLSHDELQCARRCKQRKLPASIEPIQIRREQPCQHES